MIINCYYTYFPLQLCERIYIPSRHKTKALLSSFIYIMKPCRIQVFYFLKQTTITHNADLRGKLAKRDEAEHYVMRMAILCLTAVQNMCPQQKSPLQKMFTAFLGCQITSFCYQVLHQALYIYSDIRKPNQYWILSQEMGTWISVTHFYFTRQIMEFIIRNPTREKEFDESKIQEPLSLKLYHDFETEMCFNCYYIYNSKLV